MREREREREREKERGQKQNLSAARLVKKKKTWRNSERKGKIVFPKNGGVLSKNNKGSRDIIYLSCLRFRGLLGVQNRHGEKERQKTCTRRNAKEVQGLGITTPK
jgi:hypothetical protein